MVRMIRPLAVLTAVLLAGCGSPPVAAPAPAPSSVAPPVAVDLGFDELEERFGARLGVHAINTGTGRMVSYRAGERFAHASTFKALLAGVLLRTLSDADLERVVTYTKADLLEWAPVTSRHVGSGMRVDELIAAAVQYSDNTAANLLLDEIGGPKGLQEQLRALGDDTTNTSRDEPSLNEATPGDKRDTSTPKALAETLNRLALGDALPVPRREKLIELLVGNTTGDTYIRAGVPTGWQVCDKTGSGGYGTRNDIAVAWPPGGDPLVIAIQSDRGRPNAPSDDALIAEATRTIVEALR